MRASLTIGGIEVALSTSGGSPLESLVAARYAPFLGAVERPVCSLILDANRRDETRISGEAPMAERASATSFRVLQAGLFGRIELAGAGVLDLRPTPHLLDEALCLLFGLLAPMHDGLVVRGTITAPDGAHFYVGSFDSSSPNVGGGYQFAAGGLVLLRREATLWSAASTPFAVCDDLPRLPQEARLIQMWSVPPATPLNTELPIHEAAQSTLAEHLFLPTRDPEIKRMALGLAAELATTVPFSTLTFGIAEDAPQREAC